MEEQQNSLLEKIVSRLKEKLKEDYLGEYEEKEKRIYIKVKLSSKVLSL
jgi:hypothetical protein